MPEFNHDQVIALLDKKLAAIISVQKLLLEQLAELPGALCTTDDGRDLSRVLNEQVRNESYMRDWICLARKI